MRSCIKSISPRGLRVLLIVLCLGAAVPPTAAGSIQPSARIAHDWGHLFWGTDLDEAIGRAQVSLKPILVFITAPNCPSCTQLRRFALDNGALKPVIRKFERVEIDLSKRPEMATLFKIEAVPTLLIIEPEGRIKGHTQGYVTAKALAKYLNAIAADHRSAMEIDRLITALATGRASADQWRQALSSMQNADIRSRVLALSDRLSREDIRILATCLADRKLAVRLGALGLLEGLNETIMGFDPWRADDANRQQAILAQWQQWAASGQTTSAQEAVLTRDKFDRLVQDLIGADRQRSRRALTVLARGGSSAARFIEAYFQNHPVLDDNAQRRIKEVQYALVIPKSKGLDPQATAHRIIWGNPDVQIRTIRQLADCGPGPSAILVDLLDHEAPLVRETAVESLFKAAGPRAVAPVRKLLEREKDPDVCFSALKYLGETNSVESQRILASYFADPNEDLVIAAVEGAVKLSIGSMGGKLLPLLDDPRWRVRVAAIEGLREKGGGESSLFERMRGKEKKVTPRIADALCRCLDDPDEFVRHTAAVAIGHLKIGSALKPLKRAYDRHADMRGVVVSVLLAMDQSVPSAYVDGLFGPGPDDLLFVLDQIEEVTGKNRELIQRATRSDDPDIACSALRILAGSEKRQASDNALLIRALQSGSSEKQLTIIQEFDLDSDGHKQVRQAVKTWRSPFKASALQSPPDDADVLRVAVGLMQDPSISELVRKNAMMLLYQFGYAEAFAQAMAAWPELNASMRTVAAGSLAMHGQRAIPLFKRALEDDYTDVWQAALHELSGSEGRRLFAASMQDYLLAPTGRLTPAMMWPEGLDSLCTKDPQKLGPFAHEVLSASAPLPSDRVILALAVYALAGAPESAQPSVSTLTRHENPFVRRAAWIALLMSGVDALVNHSGAIRSDPSRHVRELIPAFLYNNGFDHTRLTLYFSEDVYYANYQGLQIDLDKIIRSSGDASSSYEYGHERKINAAAIAQLKAMIAEDRDPMVRFRCMLSLLSYKIPLDLAQVYETGKRAGNPTLVAEILGEFFSSHSYDLGATFKTLLPLLQTPEGGGRHDYQVETFLRHQGGLPSPPDNTQLSFTSVRGQAAPAPVMATFSDGFGALARLHESPTEMVLFTTLGCRRCFNVENGIRLLQFQYQNLRVIRHDLMAGQRLAHQEALSRKFMADDSALARTPAVFMSGGYLVGEDINFFSLEKLARISPLDFEGSDFLSVSAEELEAADQSIRDRRGTFSCYGIAHSGLVAGWNPSALTALLLMLYYLYGAKRGGFSLLRYGLVYVFAATAITITVWLFPHGDITRSSPYLHYIGGILAWLIALYMILIALRFMLRALRSSRSKPQPKIKSEKNQKVPGRRYVLGVVVLWAVVMAVLDMLAMGDRQTVTLVYSVKNQVSLLTSIMMLALYGLMFVLPAAGLLWGLARLTRNGKAQTLVNEHPLMANLALSGIWIWMLVRYLQLL